MIATPSTPVTKPIALLADRYGSNLERLSHRQKLFVVSAFCEQLRLDCPLEDVFDTLDPNAIIPETLLDALRKLEPCPRHKRVKLMLYVLMTLLSDT